MKINFIYGDATRPIGDGPKIIVHVCNDIGGWGRGFVSALSKKWSEPEAQYRAWHLKKLGQAFGLGEVQFVRVGPELAVANLIGQRDIRPISGVPPVRYDAIRRGLVQVSAEARRSAASVHMPRIGCGLAGGNWEVVGIIVEEELVNTGVPVFVYDLPNQISKP